MDNPPQIYGPQQSSNQFTPYPTYPGPVPPPVPPKSKNKLFIILGVSGVAALGLIITLILLAPKTQEETSKAYEITKPYDSPVGLLEPFQTGTVTSGTFKLSARYVTGDDFTREGGTFFVEDGKVYFEMLPDDAKVNEFIRSLYTKQGQAAAYTLQNQGATRNFTYDFTSFMGYQYLYDPNVAPFGGLISVIEGAKIDPKAAEGKPLKLTPACDAALAQVKAKTGASLTTTSVVFDQSVHEGKLQASINLASRKALDDGVIGFLEGCFDLNQPSLSAYHNLVKNLKENTTQSPVFTYWQEEGKYLLTVRIPDSSAAVDPELRFELTEMNQSDGVRSGHTASYVERRNQFGLTYSLCRVAPVVASGSGYRFVTEDTEYHPPSESDQNYYCRTLDVPPQYQPPSTMLLKIPEGGEMTATGAEVDNQRAMHDLIFQVEKYNLDRKRYPGPTEFADLAGNNMGSLANSAQALLKNKAFVYQPKPLECIGTCEDFVFTYTSRPSVIFTRQAYKP